MDIKELQNEIERNKFIFNSETQSRGLSANSIQNMSANS